MSAKKSLISDFFKKKKPPADPPANSLKRPADADATSTSCTDGVGSGQDAKRPKSADAGWRDIVPKSVYAKQYGNVSSEKVAAFDMDGTLIRVKSGKRWPQNKDDWLVWNGAVVPKLKSLVEDGFKIVFVTNQRGVSTGNTNLSDITYKIDAVQARFDIPMVALVLTNDDLFRKPLPNAWDLIEAQFNGGVAVDKSKSLFVGDAAGRLPPVVKKKDHSDTDLKFALNVGVEFHTPEEFFLKQTQQYTKTKFEFDPRTLGANPTAFPAIPSSRNTLIILVGSPGAGKSKLATTKFNHCVRVNQDTLKSKQKCIDSCRAALSAGKSCVVDNQNKSIADRKAYLEIAKSCKSECFAVFLDVPKPFAFHMNTFRMLNKDDALHKDKVPSMVIHSFYKYVEPPYVFSSFDSNILSDSVLKVQLV